MRIARSFVLRFQLTPRVRVDDDRHELEPGAPLYKGPVVIGDNAWLGRGAVILPGVTIGAGSAVGAN